MLRGAFTAIVTPFTPQGAVDYDRLAQLVGEQVEAGVDGIVPVGTTGESPTLSFDEHHRVIETTVAAAAGRIQVIAGTGGNATEEALDLTRHAKDAGATASLQVTPYYNKPSQAGLIRHFSAVADVGLPVVLYNIPGRTCRDIELETILELAEHPHIVAVKEASGDLDRMSHIVERCDLAVLSGDDPLTLPMMSIGAVGVISVASNIIPGEVRDMVHHALEGNWAEAQALHHRYHPLFSHLLGLDTNPVPVKTALALRGRLEERFRLPMVPMDERKKKVLREVLAALELL